jgi:hypothetical protein
MVRISTQLLISRSQILSHEDTEMSISTNVDYFNIVNVEMITTLTIICI